MLVKDIMVEGVVTVDPNDTIFDASIKYRDKKVGSLVVIDNGVCVGIITERDLLERSICMHKDPEKTKISEAMSSNVKTIHALDDVETAIEIIKKYKIKKLPVVTDDKLVGIITVTDVFKAKPDISERLVDSWVKPRWRD